MRTLLVLELLVVLAFEISSKDVKCKYYEDDWAVIGRLYSCSVEDLIVRIPNETVTNIVGEHETGKANKDVRKINIQQQDCEFIPKGFEKFFPDIEGLRVAQSGLVSLQQSDINVFPRLRSVDMFNNALMTLDSDLFAMNTDIEYLYFGDNRIYSIGYNILVPLKKLSVAVFQGNSCVKKNSYNRDDGSKDALQRALNEECGKNSIGPDSMFLRSIQQRDKMAAMLKETELREEKERKELESLKAPELDQEDNSKNSVNSFIWAFIALFLILASAGVYLYLNRINETKSDDNDSITGFFPAYSVMTDEHVSPDDVRDDVNVQA